MREGSAFTGVSPSMEKGGGVWAEGTPVSDPRCFQRGGGGTLISGPRFFPGVPPSPVTGPIPGPSRRVPKPGLGYLLLRQESE